MKTLWKTFRKSGGAYKTAAVKYDGGNTVLLKIGDKAIALSRSEVADLMATLERIYGNIMKADMERIAKEEEEYRKKLEAQRLHQTEVRGSTYDITGEVIA